MTRPIIASLFGSTPIAMALDYAQTMLTAELPTEAQAEVAAGGAVARSDAERFTIHRGVAVVPVRGLLTANSFILERYLGWATYFGLIQTMNELAANADVTAVVIEGDSPGGYVTGIAGAAQAIAACAAVKPVHALVNPLAASGGYWLASQCRDITMTPGSVVGSIGVAVMASAPVQPDMRGDQNYVLTSTNARAKRPNPSTEVSIGAQN
ncbi:S49 family peptidase [Falsirhodobacter sp. 20TX0035]|uniref:S49 family peptidase n=1 Tax=Falsirhodobacter sp. 20TX0035 TaxID=3022019 RepID=UPI0023303905|nr:S49 family peptidase [Falsirhodobacter sp. 20TX0035]MDB6454484.1 S49 family peptidase [Falsirhodobacter sp. 20TX0035]